MWTEARIKQELDGNYWFFDQEGKLHNQSVDLDWMPAHKGKNPFGAVVKNDQAVVLSNESYDLILEMRADGMSWTMIAEIFQMPDSTLTDYCNRMKRIRAQYEKSMNRVKTLQAVRSEAKDKATVKIEEVRRMKADGWDYARIRKETGYNKQFIVKILEEE